MSEAVKELGIHKTYYRWTKNRGGIWASRMKGLKELEAENGWLRKAVTDDLVLDRVILQETAKGNC